jgi:hypothetical protein
MNCEYYYNFNIMLFNVLYFKKPEITLFSDVRGCFPKGVMSIIVSNTLGMKKLPRMKKLLITTNAF